MTRGCTIAAVAAMLVAGFVTAASAFDPDNPPQPVLLTWIPSPLAPNQRATRIVIDKSWRMMMIESKGEVLRVYTIGLGDDPVGHKEQRGDSRTPEGVYSIDTSAIVSGPPIGTATFDPRDTFKIPHCAA